MAGPGDDRSLGELMAELSRDTGILVRKEFELATTEMTVKVRDASVQVALTACGGALIHAGLLVVLAALVAVFVEVGLQLWLAALIVAAVTMAVGYLLVNRGMTGLRRTHFAPRQTIESLKETARWTTGQGA